MNDVENSIGNGIPNDITEDITEIELTVLVDGELKKLEMPIPFDYEGDEVLELVMADVTPLGLDGEGRLPELPELPGMPEEPGDQEGFAFDEVAGQMDPDDFDDWSARARDLQEIEWAAFALDDVGLTPGVEPGLHDDRTGEPSKLCLDETIDHDLHNVAVTGNETKAAFRAMRETCGASQASLAEALGVNVRTVKRWEAPGQPEPPRDAWRVVEGWQHDALAGARWHVGKAEELRDERHEAYTLVIYRSQEEFDRALAPLLAQAPSYRWQDAVSEGRDFANSAGRGAPRPETGNSYTNFPGTRSYWRANAAARLAAIIMDAEQVPYGFAYPEEQQDSLFWDGIWVPKVDVQRVETSEGTFVTCGMR